MASKYDGFWVAHKDVLKDLLAEAARVGTSRSLDFNAIRDFGDRQSWSGSVEVFDLTYEGAQGAAHLRALGRLLAPLTVEFSPIRFRISMNAVCHLRVEAIKLPAVPEPIARHATEIVGASLNVRLEASVHELSQTVHRLVWKLPSYRAPASLSALPVDGVYFFFEEGEETREGPRIVRVGINDTDGRFQERLRNHFHGNRLVSVFRKHLGGALLRKQGAPEVLVKRWGTGESLPKDKVVFAEIETQISGLLHDRFSFSVIPCPDASQRIELEAWLIKLLASAPLAVHSNRWLGQWAENAKIRRSGLWNVKHAGGEPVERSDLLEHLIKAVSPTNEPRDAARRPAATGSGRLADSAMLEKENLTYLACFPRKHRPEFRWDAGGDGRANPAGA